MPRTPRRCPADLIYHVLNRAVAKITLFRHDKDYTAFERALTQAHERFPINVLAYCVMPSHWHLVLQPKRDADLTAFMQWLTLTHAQRWRASHKTVGFGPLYQGRFKAFAIQPDDHLQSVLRFIERNPLRAKAIKSLDAWRWSSFHRRTNGTPEERALLANWPITRRSDWPSSLNRPQPQAEEFDIIQCIQRSRPYGDPVWQSQTAERLGLICSLRPKGRPKWKQPPNSPESPKHSR